MCHSLRWEIVRDTTPEPDDPRSWEASQRDQLQNIASLSCQ
jgi:hypothetical protein